MQIPSTGQQHRILVIISSSTIDVFKSICQNHILTFALQKVVKRIFERPEVPLFIHYNTHGQFGLLWKTSNIYTSQLMTLLSSFIHHHRRKSLLLLSSGSAWTINSLFNLSSETVLCCIKLGTDCTVLFTNQLLSLEHSMDLNITFENGPPIFSPSCPMFPSGLNCLPIAPPDETTEGF